MDAQESTRNQPFTLGRALRNRWAMLELGCHLGSHRSFVGLRVLIAAASKKCAVVERMASSLPHVLRHLSAVEAGGHERRVKTRPNLVNQCSSRVADRSRRPEPHGTLVRSRAGIARRACSGATVRLVVDFGKD